MYVVPPPNRADPLSGSTNGSDELMVYQTWKGSNVGFFLFLFLSLLSSIKLFHVVCFILSRFMPALLCDSGAIVVRFSQFEQFSLLVLVY